MPYRSLPNTDDKRLVALTTAKSKSEATPAADRAISAATHTSLVTFQPNFAQQMQERGVALSEQSDATATHTNALQTLRLLVSHFIQVFNLGIARGRYLVSERAHFQLDVNEETVPSLDAEADVFLWADRLVTGDVTRLANGGEPMENPTAAEIAAARTVAQGTANAQSAKKDAYDDEQQDVAGLRAEADTLIKDIWDEVEFTFRREEPPSLRRKAREWGVFYALRPGEPPEEEPAPPTP